MPRAERVASLSLAAALAAAAALVGGLAGGLARLGWPTLPPALAGALALHGALMVCGFFGFVIALERAAALHRRDAWAAPALAAAGSAAALAAQATLAAGLWLAAGLALTFVYLGVLRRAPALHTAVEGAGALAWAVGSALWLLGHPFGVVVAWWCAFLVLTIAGERRELARFVPLGRRARAGFLAVLGLQGAALLALALPLAAERGAARAWWLALLLLALWLLRFDLACRPGIPRRGWARHTARCLRLGYLWLALAGLWGMAAALPPDAPGPLHMLLLGFVFAMVFGHAPIVLPALLKRAVAPPGAANFAPVLAMSAGVALRAAADLGLAPALKPAAGALQALAILAFALAMLGQLRPARA